MTKSLTYLGMCHCGVAKASFRTSLDAPRVRACQCDFCRRHGAKTATDTDGFVEIHADKPLKKYHFGLLTADYLLCPDCGVYVASALEADGITRVTLNVAGLAMAPLSDALPEPVDYSGETLHERLERRRMRWTPARIIEESGQ